MREREIKMEIEIMLRIPQKRRKKPAKTVNKKSPRPKWDKEMIRK